MKLANYNDECRKVLAYFDAKHSERLVADLEDQIAEAKSGNLWVLGQLHLQGLDDPRVRQRLEREPDLMRELRKPRIEKA